MMTRKAIGSITVGLAAVLALVGPVTTASADFAAPLGSGSCAAAAAHIGSRSTAYVAHYSNSTLRGSWHNGVFYQTRYSNMPATYSNARVVGYNDQGAGASLDWAYVGCGIA